MVKDIIDLIGLFPEVDLNYGYWHMHLPFSQIFIDSSKTPSQVRRLCIQTLIDSVKHLIEIKPKLNIPTRVVAAINLPSLWHSQIIIFFSEDYFSSFFNRNNDYQKWIPLPDKRSIIQEWNLKIPDTFKVKGYKEEINDEDYKATSELWYIGEID